jgi:hypothetical protein
MRHSLGVTPRLLRFFMAGAIGVGFGGCLPSHYRMGYHQLSLDPPHAVVSPVSHKVDALAAGIEERFISRLAKTDAAGALPLLAPALRSEFTGDVIATVTATLAEYGFTGRHELVIVNEGPTFVLDNAVIKPPFRFFDYVGATYRLEGAVEAQVRVFVTEVDGQARVCGFELAPAKGIKSQAPPLRFLAPESVDKAGIKSRAARKHRQL